MFPDSVFLEFRLTKISSYNPIKNLKHAIFRVASFADPIRRLQRCRDVVRAGAKLDGVVQEFGVEKRQLVVGNESGRTSHPGGNVLRGILSTRLFDAVVSDA